MSDIQVKLSAINAAFDAAFNTKQVQKITQLYDENAVVLPAPAGVPVKGLKAIEAFFGGLITAGVIEHKLTLTQAVQDGNLAYQIGQWGGAMVNAEGAKQTFGGNVQLIYHKQTNGDWKAISHIWN